MPRLSDEQRDEREYQAARRRVKERSSAELARRMAPVPKGALPKQPKVNSFADAIDPLGLGCVGKKAQR